MTRLRFDRLGRMSAHEWRWRTQGVLYTLEERARTRLRSTHWDRQDLQTVLTPATLDTCRDAVTRGRWDAVQDALAGAITRRPSRFVLNPSSAIAMREQVLARWPEARQQAADRADRLLDGAYDLLGYRDVRCAPGGAIDWHLDPIHQRHAPRVFYADVPFLDPRFGDHKIIWELNRHQHWLQLGRAAWLTGDGRYAREVRAQLDSWLADNPPCVGINWASMLEIGFRTLSWTWALHCLLGTPNCQLATPNEERQIGSRQLGVGRSYWLVDMLVALDRQLTHVERHLSYYFSPNTHLTGEALALYVVGTALPELAASERWARTGRQVLLDEIDRQILDDGGHVERSTHYQRYTLDFYLLATLTARLAGDTSAALRFEHATRRLAEFTRTIAEPDGRLALIGDDDGGMLWPVTGRACNDIRDSLAVAATVLDRPDLAVWGIPEEAFWISGVRAADVPALAAGRVESRLLGATGYVVARGCDGSHAVLDAGAHGYLNAGHAHADALSLTLSLDGRRVLIDPGTSTYTMDPVLRDRLRSTASHNTVIVDGRSQSIPAGPFHWRSTVDARVVMWRRSVFDFIEAAHDGYAPARHRRVVVRTSDFGWLIVDVIGGSGHHHAAAHWHFDPAWQVTGQEQRLRAVHATGDAVWMLCAGGDTTRWRGEANGAGWCAPVYGQLVPTWCVRVATEHDAPFALVTWIGSGRMFSAPSLRCTQTNVAGDVVVTAEIVDGHRSASFLVRASETPHPRRVCRIGEFDTDAAMLQYVTEKGQLRSLSLVDGQHVITAREGWPSVAADAPITDLYLNVRDEEEVDFQSSHPTGALSVQGLAGWRRVRTNGRDLPLSSKSTTDCLLIHGSDWLPFLRGNSATDEPAHCGAAFADQ